MLGYDSAASITCIGHGQYWRRSAEHHAQLERLVDRFAARLADCCCHSSGCGVDSAAGVTEASALTAALRACAEMCHQLTCVATPFVAGNGRVARLLCAFGLACVMGGRSFVSMSSGSADPCADWLAAVRAFADEQHDAGRRTQLELLLTVSLWRQWHNFAFNCLLQFDPDEYFKPAF